MYVRMYVRTCVRMYVCICVFVQACTERNVGVYVCVYLCLDVCMHVLMYVQRERERQRVLCHRLSCPSPFRGALQTTLNPCMQVASMRQISSSSQALISFYSLVRELGGRRFSWPGNKLGVWGRVRSGVKATDLHPSCQKS